MATRATSEGECPSATRSRERATRCLTPTPARVFPRSPARRSSARAPAPVRRPCGAARAHRGAPPCRPRLAAALEQLLPPAVVERLRDRMLTTDLLHLAVAAQAGQHDLDLLLRRPAPVLALLAQPHLLVGRAAHAEPAAGQSLRRYAPPGLRGVRLPQN